MAQLNTNVGDYNIKVDGNMNLDVRERLQRNH